MFNNYFESFSPPEIEMIPIEGTSTWVFVNFERYCFADEEYEHRQHYVLPLSDSSFEIAGLIRIWQSGISNHLLRALLNLRGVFSVPHVANRPQ